MPPSTPITRECSLEELDPRLKAALRSHMAQYKLGDLESAILMCCESLSTRRKKGVFGGSEKVISAIFVTPSWLVWAQGLGAGAVTAESAELRNIDVHDYGSTAMGAINPEVGLNITGRYTDNRQTGIAFIALASDGAGGKFRRTLEQALKEARAR